MARWVRRRVPAGRVLALANQTQGALERYGITRAQADAEVWLVFRDGRRIGGAAAVNRVMSEAGGLWSVLAAPYRLPPIAWIEDRAYEWFSAHRSAFHRFGVTPECDDPRAGCD